jgi:hemin uptake protein HemP
MVEAAAYQSHELLGEFEEFIIEHAGEKYRLRRTRLNKLILTK